MSLIGNSDVRSTAASADDDAMQLLQERRFDGVVYGYHPPDSSIDSVIDKLHENSALSEVPVVMYSEEPLLLDVAIAPTETFRP